MHVDVKGSQERLGSSIQRIGSMARKDINLEARASAMNLIYFQTED